jgi:hypothetical protein
MIEIPPGRGTLQNDAGPIGKMKRQIIAQLLEQEDFILLVVQVGQPGVQLPGPLLEAGQPVALHIGWRMPVPIPDLALGEEAITGTLSFNRNPFACRLPWAAIVQVSVGDEHLVWLSPASAAMSQSAKPLKREPPKLRLV